MKYKIVSLLLVFVLLFMFTFQPIHKSQAVAIPLATHFGGYTAAQAFLGWLLLMDKLGVQFNALEEAEKLYENWQLENMNEPLDPQPPEGQTPQRDWLRWVLGIATGATLVDSIGDLFGDVKSWLEGLFGDISPGTNTLQNNSNYKNGYNYTVYSTYINNVFTYYINIKGIDISLWSITSPTIYSNSLLINNIFVYNNQLQLSYNLSVEYWSTAWSEKRTINLSNQGKSTGITDITIEEIIDNESISATITTDAPILNPSYSPPSTPIPPALPALPTLDPDNEKIGIVPAPDGNMQQIYEGTYEDYFKDYVENVTWDDLQNPTLPRTTIQEGTDSQGNPIIIINPSVNSPAFPNPNTDPEADTGVFQGTLIGLTQIVVNWLKLIWEAITAIPQWLTELVVPSEGYWGGIADRFINELGYKIFDDESIYIINSISGIEPLPIPDLYYKDAVILEADWVNDMAPYIKDWLTFFIIVLAALMNLNNIYKLIRGVDLIHLGGGPKDDNSNKRDPYFLV